MKRNTVIIALMAWLLCSATAMAAPFRFVGGDVSLLPDYEAANAKYYDRNGRPVADVLGFCRDEGMNCMRVRLFVNPEDYTGKEKDPNAKQDIDYIIPLCKRIQDDGMALILDFHYSDTWADPAKQWTPLAWQGLSDVELYQQIYDYTKETLQTLKAAGVDPEFIQPGNEISYGMLWGPEGASSLKKIHATDNANWARFHTLLRKAIQACREECPEAKIIIHTERVAQPWYLKAFYEKLDGYKLDYDIIGLSYYPYFHGSMSVLAAALDELQTDFPTKEVMLVETGFPYAWEVPGTTEKVDYPYTEAGQNQFAKDLVDTLLKYENCTGLFWWWFEYNAKGTQLSGWYNAPLFNSNTGRATPALSTICSFGSGPYEAGIDGVEAEALDGDGKWYLLNGVRLEGAPTLPGIYIHNRNKVIRK